MPYVFYIRMYVLKKLDNCNLVCVCACVCVCVCVRVCLIFICIDTYIQQAHFHFCELTIFNMSINGSKKNM